MSTQPKLLRLEFKDIAIGQTFFDPISAEYFVKRTDTLAAMVSGIGNGSIPDEFEPDDVVAIIQN